MIGFDQEKARRACRRHSRRLTFAVVTALLAAPLFVKEIVSLVLRGRIGPAGELIAVLVVVYLVLWPMLTRGDVRETLSRAKHMHLYGSPVRVRLLRKWPVLAGLFGYVRVERADAAADAPPLRWCFGMPADLKALRVGEVFEAVETRELRKGSRKEAIRVWLPFWREDHARPAPQAEEAQPGDADEQAGRILRALADVLRPLETKLERSKARSAVSQKAAGCATMVVVFAVLVARPGRAFLFAMAGALVAIWAVGKLWGLTERRPTAEAAARFDERFPLGSAERQAALMILSEDKDAGAAWERLRKALGVGRPRPR